MGNLFLVELHSGTVAWSDILKKKLNTSFIASCIFAKMLNSLMQRESEAFRCCHDQD